MDEAGDIGGDHPVPVLQRSLPGGGQAQRQSGVVHQHIDAPPIFRQGREKFGDGLGVGHIQGRGEQGRTEFFRQRLETFDPPPGGDDAMAVAHETAGESGAETGGGACDENGFHRNPDFAPGQNWAW